MRACGKILEQCHGAGRIKLTRTFGTRKLIRHGMNEEKFYNSKISSIERKRVLIKILFYFVNRVSMYDKAV